MNDHPADWMKEDFFYVHSKLNDLIEFIATQSVYDAM